MTQKIDYKKQLKHLYAPSAKHAAFVEVPSMQFLMIDGIGDPGTSIDYSQAVEALFSVSYTLKFMIKKADGVDYGVLPLEGLWWADDMKDFITGERSRWKWTMMIMQPEYVSVTHVSDAMEQVAAKKALPSLARLRFEAFAEGQTAQILHIGPFTEEGPTIERLHQFIEAAGHSLAGKHHEIYLSDIRRAAPEKWRTVIRQPFS